MGKKLGKDDPALAASEQIDIIINKQTDWRGAKLAEFRATICGSDPRIYEEVKWKKPSKPEGSAVWSKDGIICVADILKQAVRLTFPKGALVPDPDGIFNTRLDSKSVRAVDCSEPDVINSSALQKIVAEIITLNESK